MNETNYPTTRLDRRFSSENAASTEWEKAREQLGKAELYWLSTVRPDGRPHVTPLIAVWVDDSMFFCTGASERKYKNIESNPHCVLTTGSNTLNEGLDLVIEGVAEPVRDSALLQRIADAYLAKYGSEWTFTIDEGAFEHRGGRAFVYEVQPEQAFGFGKGEFSQTRWRF